MRRTGAGNAPGLGNWVVLMTKAEARQLLRDWPAVGILNRMLELGRPEYVRIA